jgi:multidrug efflux pump subunit AcrA (membrane-fusion protein)
MNIKNILLFVPRRLTQFKKWYFKTSWLKRILATIAIIAVVMILKNIIFPSNKAKYTFDTVQKADIVQLVTENGNVLSGNQTDIYSPSTGVLDTLFIKNGDNVKKGDKLFTVRSTATVQEQAASYSNYSQASTNLTNVQNNLRSAKASLDHTLDDIHLYQYGNGGMSNVGSANETEAQRDTRTRAQVAYDNAQSALASANAAKNSAWLAYQATQNAVVTAPVAGTVQNIVGLVGTKVIAQLNSTAAAQSAQSGVATPILIIGNNKDYAIKTSVSEVDINKIALDQKVDIVFSAIPNKSYTGHIIQLDSYGTNSQGVITYNVFISIDNPDNSIKQNMSTSLTINTDARKSVVTVANSSIVPYQSGKAVQILDAKGKVTFVPVTLGLRGFTRSEVLSGVNEGTKIILGNTQITNNQSGGPDSAANN